MKLQEAPNGHLGVYRPIPGVNVGEFSYSVVFLEIYGAAKFHLKILASMSL